MDPRVAGRPQAGAALLLPRSGAQSGKARDGRHSGALPGLHDRGVLRQGTGTEKSETHGAGIRGPVSLRGRRAALHRPLRPWQDSSLLCDSVRADLDERGARTVRGFLQPPEPDRHVFSARIGELPGGHPRALRGCRADRPGRDRSHPSPPLGAGRSLRPPEHAVQPQEDHDRDDELRRRTGGRVRPEDDSGGPGGVPDSQPALRNVSGGATLGRRLPQTRPERADPVPLLNSPCGLGSTAPVLLLLAALTGCAGVPRAPVPAGSTPPVAVSPTPSPPGKRASGGGAAAVPLPADSAPSATRAEIVRGPLRFRPEGAAAGGFQVQAGAFSQEDPARQRLERLASQFGVAGTVAFSADRGVYRVLLGAFSDRVSAQALADKLRGAGEEATAVEGRASVPAAAAAFLNVTVEDGSTRRLLSPADIYPADADARVLI